MLLVGQQGHPAHCGMLAWLVWGNAQICMWPRWCHCHSLSLAPVTPDWFYLSGTGSRVVTDKWPLNGCCICLAVPLIGDVVLVVVLWRPALSAPVTALRWEPVNVHLIFSVSIQGGPKKVRPLRLKAHICLCLQNAWTNFHDFWHCCTSVSAEHICWFQIHDFLYKVAPPGER